MRGSGRFEVRLGSRLRAGLVVLDHARRPVHAIFNALFVDGRGERGEKGLFRVRRRRAVLHGLDLFRKAGVRVRVARGELVMSRAARTAYVKSCQRVPLQSLPIGRTESMPDAL